MMSLVFLLVVGMLPACQLEDDVPDRLEGGIEEDLEQFDASEMPVIAEGFLATDRPWRAAQTMRRYRDLVEAISDDERVLAARAEAGWNAWPEVFLLLDGVSALDTYDDGIGLYLLGRAKDELGDVGGAVDAYTSFLALSPPAGELTGERSAARLRLGLALVALGEREAAREHLERSSRQAAGAAPWLRLLEADALAETGDLAAVEESVAGFDSGFQGLRAWRARIAAAWNAGDLARARALANQARGWATTSSSRSEFLVTAGRAAVAMDDVPPGRTAFRSAINISASGIWAREAAAELLAGDMTPDDHLAVARVYRAQGLHVEAIDGFRRWLRSGGGSADERAAVHMEHANALFWAQRYDDVRDALQPIARQTSARFLRARAEAHLRNTDDAVRMYLELAQEFAGSANGTQALYLAASARHDVGQTDEARELYRRVVARYPGSTYMGLAMMRLAGMAFLEGDYADAARLWDEYLARYPRGNNALAATYWSGRAHEEMGDAATARARYQSTRQRDRDGYYGLQASDRLGEPFWPLPMSASPSEDAQAAERVATWMQGIDLLRTAGYPDEASAEADRVVSAAGSDRATLFALAEALSDRGYSRRAIRIGLRLQRGTPSRRLLRILYPFPYRTLITEEARDRDIDPFVSAALIRQESMFEERITSHVGARGLMQIMPATGRELADAAGIDEWDDELLYHPEINVHLGTRYLTRHWQNYDGSLPAVFSAYNAGWHRVEWWSEFPEYEHDELFIERIPFRETRDYVKILTRNRALYSGLYAEEDQGG